MDNAARDSMYEAPGFRPYVARYIRPSSVNRPSGCFRSTAAIQMTEKLRGRGAATGSILPLAFSTAKNDCLLRLHFKPESAFSLMVR